VLLPPRWDDVTLDGDFAFLPDDMPSVKAGELFKRAFPQLKAKSQIVFAISKPDAPLSDDELRFADRMASPLQNAQGIALFRRALEVPTEDESQPRFSRDRQQETLLQAVEAWQEAALLDSQNWHPHWNMAHAFRLMGETEKAEQARLIAEGINPDLENQAPTIVPTDGFRWNLSDVLTRFTAGRGDLLVGEDNQIVLVVVELENEFVATDNIYVLQQATLFCELWQERAREQGHSQLNIGVTGNAAIGGEMLLAAKESIANTELYTVVLVVIILLVIYRSPLMILLPLLSIATSFIISSWLVALLADLHNYPGWEWFDFKVFKTSRIFIVVILFGAGTDFCLFLMGRYREELVATRYHPWAIARALYGVGDALTASALTTVIGLGMMFFADFEKYKYSGPAIGLCLLITLLVCLTFSPALLRLFGPFLFWPGTGLSKRDDNNPRAQRTRHAPFWKYIAGLVCRRPILLLCSVMVLLGPLGANSIYHRITTGQAANVSFDLLADLGNDRIAKKTALRMQQHFPQGESGPVTFLAYNPQVDFDGAEGKQVIRQLSEVLFNVDEDVEKVFSSQQPRGDRPGPFSFSRKGRELQILRAHRRTKEFFLAQGDDLTGKVALVRVVVDRNPFSPQAIRLLGEMEQDLQAEISQLPAPWNETTILAQGTTASIRDLKSVTQSDQQRIEWMVIVAVFFVLLTILRKPLVCAYMIGSVLFSYYVTIGISELFFHAVYPETFHALDGKVPLFLFVILAAIGQDYNVYLATRVFEEQKQRGAFTGLKRGIASTGGIITSCGLVMAGTFASMCMGSLLGVVEIGFALTVGVLLDTFVVRTIMLPCFLAIVARLQGHQLDKEVFG